MTLRESFFASGVLDKLPIREGGFVILSYLPYLGNDGDLTDVRPVLTGNLSEDNPERLEEPTVPL